MAITFESIINQVLNRLGAIKGATAADAESNYSAAPSAATVIGPDFTPSMVNDALAATLSEIVEAIASTPHHPERQRFADVTGVLAHKDSIPQTGSGGDRIIGVPGYVKDASDGLACDPASLDQVRSYTRFASTIYNGADLYFYCVNGGRIEHTRTNGVILEVCVYVRPTSFTGDINLEEHHEGGLVAGTVAKLALKESMFRDLYDAANAEWMAHLVKIKSYADPTLYSTATAAPSTT